MFLRGMSLIYKKNNLPASMGRKWMGPGISISLLWSTILTISFCFPRLQGWSVAWDKEIMRPRMLSRMLLRTIVSPWGCLGCLWHGGRGQKAVWQRNSVLRIKRACNDRVLERWRWMKGWLS